MAKARTRDSMKLEEESKALAEVLKALEPSAGGEFYVQIGDFKIADGAYMAHVRGELQGKLRARIAEIAKVLA